MYRRSPILTGLILTGLSFAGGCASAPVPPGQRVGEPIRGQEIYELSTVQANPREYFDRTLLVEARVAAVCQSMGCWMQIEDGGQTALVRWEAGCGGQYEFPKDSAGERIVIQGSFYPKVIDAAGIEHLEGETDREIEIPADGYELNASAVVMLDRK